ncbi:hypothetical protein [Flindersiella endophytica]
MNAVSEPITDLFDLELELIEETPSDGKERCLRTSYQSSCGGPLCRLQA